MEWGSQKWYERKKVSEGVDEDRNAFKCFIRNRPNFWEYLIFEYVLVAVAVVFLEWFCWRFMFKAIHKFHPHFYVLMLLLLTNAVGKLSVCYTQGFYYKEYCSCIFIKLTKENYMKKHCWCDQEAKLSEWCIIVK